MNEFPFFYNKVSPTTWVHLSSLLTIAIFFKFSRLWSVRNLDLIGLILVAPGLLAVQYGHVVHRESVEQFGYLWLFGMAALFLIRMLLDPMMVRRPLLEPNLSVGGLTFLGISLFCFLMANVLIGPPDAEANFAAAAVTSDVGTNVTVALKGAPADGAAAQPANADLDRTARDGPGYPLLFRIPNIITQNMSVLNTEHQALQPTGATADGMQQPAPPAKPELAKSADDSDSPPASEPASDTTNPAVSVAPSPPAASTPEPPPAAVAKESPPQQFSVDLLATRAALVGLHLAIVLGLVLIGYRHFDNVRTGIAAAALYLMLPYTAEMTGYIRHVLPAAALVWAIVCYRRPLLAGVFIGLAIGLSYYPIFLLPLWMSFYWQRGLMRFVSGVVAPLVILVGVLALTAGSHAAFLGDVQQMFGWTIPRMVKENFEGFWHLKLLDPVYRIPVLAAFFALSGTMAIWPAQKNLGTLMSCSAAVMLASQFWNAHRGGLFMAWYLPLLLLTIFRPNLEDRVALSVLGQSWFPRRRPQLRIERAA